MTKTIFMVATAMLTALTLGLSACNTIHGAGKDVKSAGQAVEDSADDARPRN